MTDLHELLVRRLLINTQLSDAQNTVLATLPFTTRNICADQMIVKPGDRVTECCMVVRGMLCSAKITSTGVRQITSFFLRGDLPDLHSLHLGALDDALCAVTPATVAFVPHAAILDAVERVPSLNGPLWRHTLIDSAIFREWVVNLGARPAMARLAHIFCELMLRFRAAGLARKDGYDLPLSQTELGEAAGLSTVHVNRVLRELRDAGLVVFRRGVLQILDWDRLRELGDFDAGFLHHREGVGAKA